MVQLETPVAMIVFRRPDVTRRVFAAVAAARPKSLFLIADGPRTDCPEESVLCAEVRKIVTAVDWPCQVETNFAEKNMGLRRRVVSGLNWVFSHVQEAILLEDDCLPDPSFFPFCAELLDRYRDQPQIGFIAGFNPLEGSFPFQFSYYFSQMTHIWGWATWRRAWQHYDGELQSWPAVREAGLLRLLFPDRRAAAYWSKIFEGMYQGKGPDTWDYQWAYTCWMQSWVNIVPRQNLIQNIGFGVDATNTSLSVPGLNLRASSIPFPLRHPPAVTPWPAHLRETQRRFFSRSIIRRILDRIRPWLGSVAH